MKAEHRKELETNVLADRMGRLVQNLRSGPPAASTIAWVIGAIAIVVLVAWLFARGSSGNRSELWVQLDGNSDPKALEKIAADHPGTIPARVARFQRARLLLANGLDSLCPDERAASPEQTKERERAVADIQEAQHTFEALAAESKDDPILTQEAYLGAGKAEEALVKVPKSDNPGESRGDVARALGFYRKALDGLDPENPLAKLLSEHIQALEKDGKDVQEFYANLNRITETEIKRFK